MDVLSGEAKGELSRILLQEAESNAVKDCKVGGNLHGKFHVSEVGA
jgi:hypothetical protein